MRLVRVGPPVVLGTETRALRTYQDALDASVASPAALRAVVVRGEADRWDWHLLNVMMNLTVNHRVEAHYELITAGRVRQWADTVFDEALREE